MNIAQCVLLVRGLTEYDVREVKGGKDNGGDVSNIFLSDTFISHSIRGTISLHAGYLHCTQDSYIARRILTSRPPCVQPE